MSARCDVAIIGAGPVGAWLALRLTQLGHDVRVLEQRLAPSVWSRAIGVHPPALACLREVGVRDELVRAGVRITRAAACAGRTPIAHADFSTLPCSERYVLSVPQSTTERALERALERVAPGSVTRGAEVQDILDDGAEDVRVHYRVAGVPHVLAARLVVGCDGKHSVVRRAIGAQFQGGPTGDGFLMGDTLGSAELGARAFVSLSPAGVVESFPLPDARRRWVVRTGDTRPALCAETLARAIHERTGHVVDARAFEVVSAFEAERLDTTRWYHGRVVLCGDAAHVISPLGGQGMNVGLLDARALAYALDPVLSGECELAPVLRRYAHERAACALAAQRRARIYLSLARPGAARHGIATWLVRRLLAPGVRRHTSAAFAMARAR